ncbi:MAG: hypothetical protein ACFFCW_18455 [Candidatus Hodarchaeota archaeon]
MDFRHKTFKTKFKNAAKCLGVRPEQVISLKFREIVRSYHEYDLLMDMLEHEAGIVSSPVHENLQGQGHLIHDGKNQIIVVQHETGLEILYMFGSIASLLGLIPVVIQCWSRIRGNSRRQHIDQSKQIEIRRLDKKGRIVEDRVPRLIGGFVSPFTLINNALIFAAQAIDSYLKTLKSELQALTVRVETLEKNRKIKKKPSSKKPSMSSKKNL